MLERLNNYDWKQVFDYADGSEDSPTAVLGSSRRISPSPFTREDVKRIIAIEDGENDETAWIGVFELHDGRFACIRAYCDYTGWS